MYQERVASLIHNTMDATLRTRWRLIESALSTIDWPFLIVLMLWLAVIFLVFALTSPRHAVLQVVIALSAISLASVMYVILELDTPFSGTMMVSSAPLRDALAHIDRPAGF
jgi:membrane-bound ClpP family serine protease